MFTWISVNVSIIFLLWDWVSSLPLLQSFVVCLIWLILQCVPGFLRRLVVFFVSFFFLFFFLAQWSSGLLLECFRWQHSQKLWKAKWLFSPSVRSIAADRSPILLLRPETSSATWIPHTYPDAGSGRTPPTHTAPSWSLAGHRDYKHSWVVVVDANIPPGNPQISTGKIPPKTWHLNALVPLLFVSRYSSPS